MPTNPLDFANLPDETLIKHYQETKDEEAFAEIFSRYQCGLIQWISSRYSVDPETAEDLVQQTFLRVHTKAHLYDPARSFKAWLCSIAANETINNTTTNQRQKRGGNDKTGSLSLKESGHNNAWHNREDPPCPDDTIKKLVKTSEHEPLVLELIPAEVVNALDNLTEQERQIITLLFYENLPEREVAQRLEITRHELRVKYKAAMVQLKHELSGVTKVA